MAAQTARIQPLSTSSFLLRALRSCSATQFHPHRSIGAFLKTGISVRRQEAFDSLPPQVPSRGTGIPSTNFSRHPLSLRRMGGMWSSWDHQGSQKRWSHSRNSGRDGMDSDWRYLEQGLGLSGDQTLHLFLKAGLSKVCLPFFAPLHPFRGQTEVSGCMCMRGMISCHGLDAAMG